MQVTGIDSRQEAMRPSTYLEKLHNLDSKKLSANDRKLVEASSEFEAIFIQQMLRTMQSTLNDDNPLLPKTQGHKLYEDMLYEEYSKSIARHGSMGLGRMIYEEMAKLVEAQQSIDILQ